jgi:hypothetical protein
VLDADSVGVGDALEVLEGVIDGDAPTLRVGVWEGVGVLLPVILSVAFAVDVDAALGCAE